ncbi:hypothetical protein EG329_013900 [Mollisiaceae sp. DMI_Dod_QoI]|nr:hypothetical protein EG329_013900 [Helotiales sp. DMI_Dod_QoI]
MYSFTFGFFCCESGQIAVNPITGYDGLCVASDQAVPKSLLATTATQVVGSATTSVTDSPSTTAPSSSQTSAPTKGTSLTDSSSGRSSSPTGSSSASTTTGSSSSAGTSNTSNTTNKSSSPALGTGPIIGIVIGGLGLILLAGIFYALMRRRKPQQQPQIQYVHAPTGVTELPPTVGRKPVPHMMATSMYSATTPNTGGFPQQPPQYGSEGLESYEPTTSPPPPIPHPYDTYAEMEGRGGVERAELRADRTGG